MRFVCSRPVIRSLLSLGVLLSATPVQAQDDRSHEGPRIGLVLSGGGARGAAHIGVLEVLEELQVPIDSISGTSMGAIVGGLYAVGLSPAEIREELEAIDWDDMFRDGPPRSDLTLRRRTDDADWAVDFALGFRDGALVLPRGLVQGQKLELLLERLIVPRARSRHFDALPIPFRAVATDLETGEGVVFSHGELALALRASMSVPGAFAPAEVDGRLYVDGGVANNLPVDAVREMGAEVVIAVDLTVPLRERQALASVLDVSNQVLDILMLEDVERQRALLGATDVRIEPQLGELGSTDFGSVAAIADLGRDAALATRKELAGLALDDADWNAWLTEHRRRVDELPIVESIRIENDSRLANAVLEKMLSVETGERLDLDELHADLSRIYGLGFFERVDASIEEGDGGAELALRAIEKSWGPNYIRFGLSLEDDFEGTSLYNLATGYTVLPLNRYGAEWRSEFLLGSHQAVVTELYQPLGYGSPWFVAPELGYRERTTPVVEDGTQTAELRVSDWGVRLALGRELGRATEFRLGLVRRAGKAVPQVGPVGLETTDFDDGAFVAQLRHDSLDDPDFPRTGTLVSGQYAWSRESLGADVEFELGQAEVLHALSAGRHTLIGGLRLGSVFDGGAPAQDQFALGGFLALSGLQRNELAGQDVGLARLIYTRRVGGDVWEDSPLVLGGSLELGNVWEADESIELDSAIVAGSVLAGIQTFFGPLYVAFGAAEGGSTSFYLFLGRTF